MDWWQDFFDESYLKLWANAPSMSPERTAQTVAAIQQIVPRGAAILDVACGHGRIAIPLAQVGYRVTGVDYSGAMLAIARRAAAEAHTSVNLIQADMRELAFDCEFDAAINIFTAFGYFGSDEENQRALDSMARALKPGGKLLMDTNHRDRVVKHFSEKDWDEVSGTVMWTRRESDAVRGIWSEHISWLEKGGGKHRHFSVRNYVPTELARMLFAAGLEPMHWYGDFDLSPFTSDSRRMIVVAEKP